MIPSNSVVGLRRFFRVGEAAERLGVSPQTLKQWIYKGTLRTVQTAGGHHRISPAEVDRLLTRGSARTVSKSAKSGPRPAPLVLVALSGRNQLRGIVEEVRTDGLMAQVRLRIGHQVLTAVITRDAVESLRLKKGDEALAVIKSTEVMVAREEGTEKRRRQKE
jgi:molybdopterin-binding protein